VADLLPKRDVTFDFDRVYAWCEEHDGDATEGWLALVTPIKGETPEQCVRRCQDDDRHFNQEKWGDAACVDAGPDPANKRCHVFIFFGVASS
jgi:hypothetical protein